MANWPSWMTCLNALKAIFISEAIKMYKRNDAVPKASQS